MKAGIVEWIDTAITGQWHNKHVSAATDTETIIEDTVFSMWSLPWLNDEEQLDKSVRGWSRRLVVVSCKSAVAVHGWLSVSPSLEAATYQQLVTTE
jgi:hypothetical protein